MCLQTYNVISLTVILYLLLFIPDFRYTTYFSLVSRFTCNTTSEMSQVPEYILTHSLLWTLALTVHYLYRITSHTHQQLAVAQLRVVLGQYQISYTFNSHIYRCLNCSENSPLGRTATVTRPPDIPIVHTFPQKELTQSAGLSTTTF
jgi:hypothetical protein